MVFSVGRDMNVNRLRPVFYRVGNWHRVWSGWIDVDTTDIWADGGEVMTMALCFMPRDTPTALSLSGLRANEHGLVLVPHAKLALTLGERVTFTQEVDMFPLDVIEAGERGVIGRRDKITGEVEVFLEQHHIKLAEYSNTVSLIPHSDDGGALAAVAPYCDRWTSQVVVDVREYTMA